MTSAHPEPAPINVLIVDDDTELLSLLKDFLGKHGYSVCCAVNSQQFWLMLNSQKIDIVILDLMLPGDSGLTICKQLRQEKHTNLPIIILSACGTETDRVVGLELGADDYLAKPFSTRELLARIRALHRRTHPATAAPYPITKRSSRVRFGDWIFDMGGRQLINNQGTSISLSGAEFSLLNAFISNRQQVLNRDRLLTLARGRDVESLDRSIDLLVSRLRARLGDSSNESRYIKTVRSEGYTFIAEVEYL